MHSRQGRQSQNVEALLEVEVGYYAVSCRHRVVDAVAAAFLSFCLISILDDSSGTNRPSDFHTMTSTGV